MNIATKSGTNQFHGDGFEFLRNNNLDARNFYSPTRGAFHQNQFGGTFGGPIRHDRVFFFADYQGTRQVIGVDTGEVPVPLHAGSDRQYVRHRQLFKRNGQWGGLGRRPLTETGLCSIQR